MPLSHERAEALVAAERATGGGDGIGMQALCRVVATLVGAAGASLSVMTKDGTRAVTASSDPAAERWEELQYTSGEGPCIDAFARRRPVLVPDLSGEAFMRWPGYAPEVYQLGLRAVFAFPLQVGAARLGVLDVFRREAGSLTREQVASVLVFAEVAVALLLDEHQRPDGSDGWSGDTLGLRAQLFQAQGMVMVQMGSTITDAVAAIRAHAYSNDRRLADVVGDIVAGRLVFERNR